MRFQYDNKEDAFYIRFNENPYEQSEEVRPGIVLDYDKKRKIVGIEVLDASKKFPRQFQLDFKKQKSFSV